MAEDKKVLKKEDQIKGEQLPIIPFVGGYAITGKGKLEHSIVFKFIKKPNRIHRFFCKLFLGWVWVGNPNEIK